MFQINDVISYGAQGVYKITAIERKAVGKTEVAVVGKAEYNNYDDWQIQYCKDDSKVGICKEFS